MASWHKIKDFTIELPYKNKQIATDLIKHYMDIIEEEYIEELKIKYKNKLAAYQKAASK